MKESDEEQTIYNEGKEAAPLPASSAGLAKETLRRSEEERLCVHGIARDVLPQRLQNE